MRPTELEPDLEGNATFPLVIFYADGSADATTIWLLSGERALAIETDPVLGSPKIAQSLIPLSSLMGGVVAP